LFCLFHSISFAWNYKGLSWSWSYVSCEFEPRSWRDVLNTTLCYKVCQWLVAGLWFSPHTPVSSTNKTDRQDIHVTEILLKVALDTIALTLWGLFQKYVLHTNIRYLCLYYDIIILPLPEGREGYTVLPLFVCPNVRPRYFSSHFSQ
jgi:hypothetical protein